MASAKVRAGAIEIAECRIAYMKPAQHQANAAGPAKAPAAGGGVAQSKRGLTAREGVGAWLRHHCGALWLTALVLAVGATQIRSLEQEYFNDESTSAVMAGHLNSSLSGD